ncbi:threonine/homoserine/homoserine lactone efflux protein [Orenia metallireducens]|jgi:threonine/homoserine/homoserine lactone efflux protein|uniref:Threonine/homoserine/homoserine lactone efflux protein n=1 Tax=Orenia metallireducens TaxID=1413210 RepID=A0A285F1P5_9FIRM|nr:LysE family transporter [Orenia metallireducens]PRX34697.1 threonine/homoserine/homoserine lactone efflux protein [Orenia metallireducens]SNY05220.1 Threonine/homoserine/homoserine lactone efflux protein [Orenia metallireducens]
MKKVFLRGLSTGLILQIAIGPVFFFLANLALQKSLIDGLFAVAAVTIVDYLYIALAIAGIGKLLEKKKVKKTLGVISSIVLIAFGFYMAINIPETININLTISDPSSNLFKSFISAFLLTISSPLTVLFWTSLFAARSVEYSLNKKELMVFGLSAGLATPLFLSLSIFLITILKTLISPLIVQLANMLVALILIGYGILRIIKIILTNSFK